MTYFEKMLLIYLWDSELELQIKGFDIDGFKKAVAEEGKRRLEMIESIIYLDNDLMTDAEKVSTIKRYFEEDFRP